METSNETQELYKGLIEFHRELATVTIAKARVGGGGHYKYAALDDVLDAIREPLLNSGLIVVQGLHDGFLCTRIAHISGQYIETKTPFVAWEGRGGTSDLQNIGGGITYLKRYALSAILSISLDEDNDAAKPKMDNRKLDEIVDLILTHKDGAKWTLEAIEKKYTTTASQKKAIAEAMKNRWESDKAQKAKNDKKAEA